MSNAITDTTGVPLLFVNLRLDEGTDSVVVVARIPCAAGKVLASISDAAAAVLARRTGSGDSFVNIAASPISLTEFDGEDIDFDFKVHAGTIVGLARVALPVRVGYPS
jgi:hypothetical protein